MVLRDVMGFRAIEVAAMLDTTVASVNSSLHRARTNLEMRRSASIASAPALGSHSEQAITARFVRAYEAADVRALVELFTDDVFVSMPPLPLEYVGRDAASLFFTALLGSGRRYSLVSTRANRSPAFGAYVMAPGGGWHATGLLVIEVAAEGIAALTRFETRDLPWFGLPMTLARA
jgi:RNA polymerase sigma-70 factor (ECF subfamily)